MEQDYKVFNDPIHGHIKLHPLLVSIIDTPQFQRLRCIKQLGGKYHVFPGASHNRFEHSLGVCHLAGEFVKSLKHDQQFDKCLKEEQKINDQDVLCIQIAGLCHDLGHGPFSHVFDGQFIPRFKGRESWKHEEASIDMLEHMVKENNNCLLLEFEKYQLTKRDVDFIKELIFGDALELRRYSFYTLTTSFVSEIWRYRGRDRGKSFLYEIVSNKRNGVDVDKWDYFARDCHHLGLGNSFDWKRHIKFARVIKVDGFYQICCRDKEIHNLYEMFHTRTILHRRAYQHKTACAVELMITDALVAANDEIYLYGKEKKPFRISDSIDDMVAYTQLTDNVLQQILMSESTTENMKKAQQLLKRIETRKLYRYLGQTEPINKLFSDKEQNEKEDEIGRQMRTNGLSKDDFHIQFVRFDYGSKEKDPMSQMKFYNKVKPDTSVDKPPYVSHMLPKSFCETYIRVYYKSLDEDILKLAASWFERWCKQYNDDLRAKLKSLSV